MFTVEGDAVVESIVPLDSVETEPAAKMSAPPVCT